MDWARLLHCNLGWNCENFHHQICFFFSPKCNFFDVTRQFADNLNRGSSSLSALSAAQIALWLTYAVTFHCLTTLSAQFQGDHLSLIVHPLARCCPVGKRATCDPGQGETLWPWPKKKKKKTKQKYSANGPKTGHTHFSTQCLIRPKECCPFLSQVQSLTGKAFDAASPGWFSGSS